MSTEKQSAAGQAVVDLNDPKVLLGMLSQMFKSQAESTEINRKLLQLELAKKEAQDNKDQVALAKLEKAREQSLGELKRKGENDKKRWARCSHKDQTQGWTIWPISNMPDHQLIGYCSLCGMPVLPQHVEEDAYGKKTVVPEHKLYHIVLEREQHLYSSFLPVMSY